MVKKEEGWTNRDTCTFMVMCVLFYAAGLYCLLYLKSLFGIGFILVSSLISIPTAIELYRKSIEYAENRRREKLRNNRKTIVVGGVVQGERVHKHKRQTDISDYPLINDETSKGELMRELGLWYEKARGSISFEERKSVEPTRSPTPTLGRTYRQLNELFDALNYHKRIRIAHNANLSSNHHGSSIKKMLEVEAKRRGVEVLLKQKGNDLIISKRKEAI